VVNCKKRLFSITVICCQSYWRHFNIRCRNSVTHVMIYIGRITNINLLYLQFSTEGRVVRLQSSAVVCFRPLLFWGLTQHWLWDYSLLLWCVLGLCCSGILHSIGSPYSLNTEPTGHPKISVTNYQPKLCDVREEWRLKGLVLSAENLHLPVILHLLIFCCNS
jgi:hypothetical protein